MINTNSALEQSHEGSAHNIAAPKRGPRPLLSQDRKNSELVLNTGLLEAEVNCHDTEYIKYSDGSSHSSQPNQVNELTGIGRYVANWAAVER